MKIRSITPAVVWALALINIFGFDPIQSQTQELREFVSASGQTMQAKLVSHRKGKVTLERADGKQFEVEPVAFGIDAQNYIKQWMATTPEKKVYLLGVTGAKTKVGGDFVDLDYKRVKNEQWAYKLSITNRSTDTISGMIIRYRLFHTNRAEGQFSAGSSLGTYMTPGEAKVPGELVYNQTFEITTVPVKLDFVDYDGSGERYKDELQGCIVQILNPQGVVVHEWSNTSSPMKSRTWDNTAQIPRPPYD